MKKFSALRIRVSASISSFLSLFGLAGTTGSAVCQTTCVATSGIIPFVGISLAATPFFFLWRYHEIIWVIGLFIFFLALLSYIFKKNFGFTDKLLLFINFAILLIAFPFFKVSLLSEIVSLLGIIFFIIGLGIGVVYIFGRKKILRKISLL